MNTRGAEAARVATFLGSHVLYRCDLQHSSSVTIHLGVLAELVTDDWHLFGIAARVSLEPSELAALAPAWRDRLIRPFDYLQPEFERAWEQAKPGECIDFLAADYSGSLLIQPPAVLSPPAAAPTAPERIDLRGGIVTSIDKEAARYLNRPPAMTVNGPVRVPPHLGVRGDRSSEAALA
jgi:hypothetical protein